MRKLVRKSEVADYIAFGWRVVVVAGPPPADYDPALVLIEHPGWQYGEWKES